MTTYKKIITGLFIVFAVSAHAQNYPKYTTKKTKGTVVTKQEGVSKAAPAQAAPEKVEVPAKEEAPQKKTADFNELMKRAQQEYLAQEYDKAVKSYTEAFDVSPEAHKHIVLTKRAWAYYAIKNYNKSIEDCTTAIEKTTIPNQITYGRLYILRSLSYKGRKNAGDRELACADHQKAKEAGVLQGADLAGYDCDKK